MVAFVVVSVEESRLVHGYGADFPFLTEEGKGVEGSGGVADFVCFGGGGVEAALFCPILADGFGFFACHELMVKPVCGEFVDGKDLFAKGEVAFGRAAGLVFEVDVKFAGDEFDGLDEFEVFHLHDKAEEVAAVAGAEAFKEAAVWVDVEGGGFFLSEGAESFPGTPGAFELHVGRDHVNQVDLVFKGVNGALGDSRHVARNESGFEALRRRFGESNECGFGFWAQGMAWEAVDELLVKSRCGGAVVADSLEGAGKGEGDFRVAWEAVEGDF